MGDRREDNGLWQRVEDAENSSNDLQTHLEKIEAERDLAYEINNENALEAAKAWNRVIQIETVLDKAAAEFERRERETPYGRVAAAYNNAANHLRQNLAALKGGGADGE